jgi:hypothetical protein
MNRRKMTQEKRTFFAAEIFVVDPMGFGRSTGEKNPKSGRPMRRSIRRFSAAGKR